MAIMTNDDVVDADKAAYERICKYAAQINCAAVIWYGRFSNSLVFIKSQNLISGVLYSAVYEQLYDLISEHGQLVKSIKLGISCNSLAEVAIKLDLENGIAI